VEEDEVFSRTPPGMDTEDHGANTYTHTYTHVLDEKESRHTEQDVIMILGGDKAHIYVINGGMNALHVNLILQFKQLSYICSIMHLHPVVPD